MYKRRVVSIRLALPASAALVVLVVLAVFPCVFALGAEECADESADDAVACFVAEEASADTTGHGAHEASLAFLRVIGVCWVAGVA